MKKLELDLTKVKAEEGQLEENKTNEVPSSSSSYHSSNYESDDDRGENSPVRGYHHKAYQCFP